MNLGLITLSTCDRSIKSVLGILSQADESLKIETKRQTLKILKIMKKKFCIDFSAEKLDFFAITPFIAADKEGFAIAWIKWGINIKFYIKN